MESPSHDVLTAAAEPKDEEEDDDPEVATATWLEGISDEYEQMEVVPDLDFTTEEEEEMSGTDLPSAFRPPVPSAKRQIVRLPILSESGKGKETEAKTETGFCTSNRGGENVQFNVY